MSPTWSLPDIAPALRFSTPARILAGRCGARPLTADLLRFQVDHACARDAVRTPVDRELPDRLGCVAQIHTASHDKREYLLDPQTGRTLRQGEGERLRALLPQEAPVLVAVGDGLSSQAVESQAPLLLPALLDCLRSDKIAFAGPIFVHGARVGVLDALGEVLAPKVGILLVGERPGLATARSLSAYLGYEPRPGRTDADRNVLSNIHEGGVPALEAAAILAGWIGQMLREGRSGVGFRPAA
jgi:ethanolamine ammonia-lyase small subunit